MQYNKVWNWYKKSDGSFVKFKSASVKANSSLVDKSWTKLETCNKTGDYLDVKVSKKEEPAKKAEKAEEKADK